MKIYIEKYSWLDSVEINNVNFFSDADKTLEDTLIVYDSSTGVACLTESSFGNVNYTFANVGEDNSLFFEASDLSFSLINNTDLDSFFEIYTNTNYIKFKLFIYDGDNLIYTAIISKDGVKYSNRANSIIDITAIGYEKEFKDYFSNIKIDHPDTIPTLNPFTLTGLYFKKLTSVLIKFFGENIFDISINSFLYTNRIYIADKPYIYSPLTEMAEDSLLECKSGLINFYNSGMTKFAYFNYLCLSLGLVWFFYLDKIYIKNANDISLNELVIDYKETFISHSIENSQLDFSKENIVIEAGEYYALDGHSTRTNQFPLTVRNSSGDFYIGGYRNYVYSLLNEDTIETKVYRGLTRQDFGSDKYYIINYNNHTGKRYIDSDNYFSKYKKYVTVGTNNMSISLTTSDYIYNVNNSVTISTGVTGRSNGSYLDTTNARGDSGRYYGNGNSLSTTNAITDVEIGYTGSVGESCIFYDSVNAKYMNYDLYMRLDSTKKNFITYVKNNINVLMSLTIHKLITNPLQCNSLLNYPFANINNIKMSWSGLSFNIFTKISNLTVQY
jgi:hypothetical protein